MVNLRQKLILKKHTEAQRIKKIKFVRFSIQVR